MSRRRPVVMARIALHNEGGGVFRTVPALGTEWRFRYDEQHRETDPATRNSVEVAMADGSWCNGTLFESEEA